MVSVVEWNERLKLQIQNNGLGEIQVRDWKIWIPCMVDGNLGVGEILQ